MLLFLNDIAGSEVLLILAFILIFFGSKSIPGIARTFGRTIRQIKDASSELQSEIKKSGMDMKNDLNLSGLIQETAEDIKRPIDQYVSDLDNAVKFDPPRQSHLPIDVPVIPVVEVEKLDQSRTSETNLNPESKG